MERRLGLTLCRVVSGGQTGVDRAALDAAVACGVDCGGWCPAGGIAEDLRSPPGLLSAYPFLHETPTRDPAVRTAWNVRDSEATLVLGDADRSPGTRATVRCARRLGRPCAVFAAGAVDEVRRWLGSLPESVVLNVAGPRESEQPGVYAEAYATLCAVLASDGGSAGSTPA